MKRQLKGLVRRGVAQSGPERSAAIEKIMLSSAGLSRQPTDLQVDGLANAVLDAMKPLLAIAMSGNGHAIRRVTEVASNLCAESTMLACMHQDAANIVARERTTWPLAISNDPAERRRALRLITGPRRLPLGETELPQPVARKAFSLTTPANAAVLVALKAIQIERAFRIPSELFPVLQPEWSVAAANLPELDGNSAVTERWFEVIWMYVCQRHGGAPESSVLRKLGEHAVADKPDAEAREIAIRSGIRHALREAFQRMARRRRKQHKR